MTTSSRLGERDDRRHISRRYPKNLRHTLQVMGIPTTIEGKDLDLPALIVNSRNRVHVRSRAKPVEAVDVYEHALQTAELMVLSLANYNGHYHPRGARNVADEVRVPWAKQSL
jgi:hypothetical protein